MIHCYYRPQLPLANFVELFWLYDGYTVPHALERILPDGAMQLIINLQDDTFRFYNPLNVQNITVLRGPLLCGPHTRYGIIDTMQQASIIGVRFKPGGALPFLLMPASELCDRDVPLETFWRIAADDLRDQMMIALTPAAKFRVLEQTLLKWLLRHSRQANDAKPHPAVVFALQAFHVSPLLATHPRIADVTSQVGLSSRRFIQVFSEAVGVSPKKYCRVLRFQAILRIIAAREQVNWANLAVAGGYYDQAHFIHDFRAFAGLTPSAYAAHCPVYPRHVPFSV